MRSAFHANLTRATLVGRVGRARLELRGCCCPYAVYREVHQTGDGSWVFVGVAA